MEGKTSHYTRLVVENSQKISSPVFVKDRVCSVNNGPAQGNHAHRSQSVFRHFFIGQVFNAIKSGVWWVFLSPLLLTLFSDSSIGFMRMTFNMSVMIIAPLGGYIAEAVPARRLLIGTSIVRMLVYAFGVPLLWVAFRSGATEFWVEWDWFNAEAAFITVFLVFSVIDGGSVALSNVVDIDCGGADLLSYQYNIEADERSKARHAVWHERAFTTAIVVVTPCAAALALYISTHLQVGDERDNVSGSMVIVLGSIFLVTSMVSIVCYWKGMPSKATLRSVLDEETEISAVSRAGFVLSDLYEGTMICLKNKCIRWRLIFFALETALEDCFVLLILPEVATKILSRDHFGWGLFFQSVLVAVGKLGGMTSGVTIQKIWKPTQSSFRLLFFFVLLGTASSLLLPATIYVKRIDHYGGYLAVALACVASFSFFFHSTGPKIGFAFLMQSTAAEIDQSGRIFGFLAGVVTLVDTVLVFTFSQVFEYCNFEHTLWIVTGIFTMFGMFEFLFGSWLVVKPGKKEKERFLFRDDPDADLLLMTDPLN